MEEERSALFIALIGAAAKSIQRIKAARMDEFRLSAAHTDCLSSLAGAPEGLTQSQLAGLLAMDRAQVSRVLRDLRERAYVCVGDAPGYKSHYCLTEMGKRIAEEISRIIGDVTDYVSGSIPREDIESFYRTFRTIADRLGEAVSLYGAPQMPAMKKSEENEP